jgi:hypothetical protein
VLSLVSDLVYKDGSGCSSNTCNLLSLGYFHVRNSAKMTQIQANTRSRLVPHCGAEKEPKSVNLVEAELVVYCTVEGTHYDSILSSEMSARTMVRGRT